MTIRREIAASRREPGQGTGSASAAVPVPLLLRRGQAPIRKAPAPNSTWRVWRASPPAEGWS